MNFRATFTYCVPAFVALFTNTAAAQHKSTSHDLAAAVVNGSVIPRAAVDDATRSQIHALETQIYALKRRALEQLILEELLRQEAAKRGVDVPALRKQMAQDAIVSDSQITDFLKSNASEMVGMDPEIRRDVARLQLLSRARNGRFQEYVTRLRATADVKMLLPEPPLEMVPMPALDGPALGPANAPVTIVEFADYQCGYCMKVAPVLRELVEITYRDRMRLVFKDFPLPNHRLAEPAAVAAQCAGQQGRYWEYHDRLFSAQQSLHLDLLTAFARDLGLDLGAFASCRSSEAPLKAVRANLAEGQRLGARGTPTLVMNGKLIRGFRSREDLVKLIDAELRDSAPGSGGAK